MGLHVRRLTRALPAYLMWATVGVHAQQKDETEAGSKLEEVTVTAQFRQESQQSIPIAITAVSAAQQ